MKLRDLIIIKLEKTAIGIHGPIEGKIAMTIRIKCRSTVIVGPVIDTNHEKSTKYLNKIPLIRNLIPTHLQSAAEEKFAYGKELELLRPQLKNLNCLLIHFHGTKDKIVPYENLLFAKNYLNNPANELITLPGDNH